MDVFALSHYRIVKRHADIKIESAKFHWLLNYGDGFGGHYVESLRVLVVNKQRSQCHSHSQ